MADTKTTTEGGSASVIDDTATGIGFAGCFSAAGAAGGLVIVGTPYVRENYEVTASIPAVGERG